MRSKNKLFLGDYYRFRAYKLFHELRTMLKRPSGGSSLGDMTVLLEAAKRLGISVHSLGNEAHEFRFKDRVVRIREGMVNSRDNAFAFWLTGHKYSTFEVLRNNGIKTLPAYRLFSLETIGDAQHYFTSRRKKVVVKPCFGTSSGKGVTVGVSTKADLRKAVYTALLYDRQFLIEDHIEGENFRILMAGEEMVSTLRRIPANVRGDGKHTIGELIRLENERRENDRSDLALRGIEVGNDLRQRLRNEGMPLSFIPQKDQVVFVRYTANFTSGGEIEDVTELVHPKIVDDCRTVLKIMDLFLAGIDIITPDITKPLDAARGVLNEVNTSPSLGGHYRVRNQEDVKDFAGIVLRQMLGIGS